MPKEHKKRGRREKERNGKRKAEEAIDPPEKRVRQLEPILNSSSVDAEQWHDEDGDQHDASYDQPFYGMLNDEEQEYFKRADEMLELNQFNDADERALFLGNVYQEASNKELKLACSQSCSRLLERLILLSSPKQLKDLFQSFHSHFLHLVQHRFASHCCEALFVQAAAAVSDESTNGLDVKLDPSVNDSVVTMEVLFLQMIDDLEGQLGYLMADRHGSHVLRVILVVLSGLPLASSATTGLMRGKGKERVEISGVVAVAEGSAQDRRAVPSSFRGALEKMMAEMMANVTVSNLRLLAVHPTANPILQLLLQIETSWAGKARSQDSNTILMKLIAKHGSSTGAVDPAFLRGLLYDPVGSRLLETIVCQASGKTFKSVYRDIFRDQVGAIAKNETASFVLDKVLKRVGRADLENAMPPILAEMPLLAARSRTSLIRTLIDRSVARGADVQPIVDAVRASFGDVHGERLLKMLGRELRAHEDGEGDGELSRESPGQIHGALLARSMLAASGPLQALIEDDLLAIPATSLLEMARRPASSQVMQTALTLPTASAPFRRKLTNVLLDRVASLSVDPSGSYVVDALRSATQGLGNHAERVAAILLEHEDQLRASAVGRLVWRNWKMDLFVRRRVHWLAATKTEWRSAPSDARGGKSPTEGIEKTAIERARANFAAALAKQKQRQKQEQMQKQKQKLAAPSAASPAGGRAGRRKSST